MKHIDTADISSYYTAYAVPKDFGHKYLTTWIKEIEKMNDRFANEFEKAQYGSIAAQYKPKPAAAYSIKNVIFNPPATIVFWADNTKTVVKCGEHDEYDPEKGLAMAFTKKVLGNHGNYYNIFRKWLPKEDDEPKLNLSKSNTFSFTLDSNCISDGFYKILGIEKEEKSDE